MKRWYVVQTKVGQEELAYQQLREQKFKVFFPTFVQERKTAGGVLRTLELPLFPSYMFIKFDHKRNRRWKGIINTRGVKGLVGCTESYLTPLPEGCVEELKRQADAKGVVKLTPAVKKIMEFKPNMEVVITEGSFKGQIATYCNHTKNRVFLLLSLLERKVRVSLPLDAIHEFPLP